MKNSFLLILGALNTFVSVIFTEGIVNIPALIYVFTESSFTFVGGKIEVSILVTIPVFCLAFLPAVATLSSYPKKSTKYICVSFWSSATF